MAQENERRRQEEERRRLEEEARLRFTEEADDAEVAAVARSSQTSLLLLSALDRSTHDSERP